MIVSCFSTQILWAGETPVAAVIQGPASLQPVQLAVSKNQVPVVPQPTSQVNSQNSIDFLNTSSPLSSVIPDTGNLKDIKPVPPAQIPNSFSSEETAKTNTQVVTKPIEPNPSSISLQNGEIVQIEQPLLSTPETLIKVEEAPRDNNSYPGLGGFTITVTRSDKKVNDSSQTALLIVSKTQVNDTIVKGAPNNFSFGDGFEIKNSNPDVGGFEVIANPDAVYMPANGKPLEVFAEGFGFYTSSGSLGIEESRNIPTYIVNNLPAGTYQGSYQVRAIRDSDNAFLDVATVYYTIKVKDSAPQITTGNLKDLIPDNIRRFPKREVVAEHVEQKERFTGSAGASASMTITRASEPQSTGKETPAVNAAANPPLAPVPFEPSSAEKAREAANQEVKPYLIFKLARSSQISSRREVQHSSEPRKPFSFFKITEPNLMAAQTIPHLIQSVQALLFELSVEKK